MATPFLYPLFRLPARLLVTFYFGGLHVSGRSRLPRRGPVILAANHPQSITDALILALAAGRVLHFIAHSGLFKSPVKAFLLRGSGVIPVYRPRDVAGASERNVEMFRACREVLERGGAIGIFPEGTSQEERRVQRLKTGTARIALEAEAANGFRLGVQVVPAGILFENERRFRSKVLVNLGEPIAAADYAERYREDPAAAVDALTEDLRQRLAAQVVNLEASELDQLVRDLEMVYRGELLERPELGVAGETGFAREQTASREIARGVDHYFRTEPEFIWGLARRMEEYRRKLDRLHVSDRWIREEARPSLERAAAPLLVAGAIGLPFALYGAFWNILPYKFTGWLAKRKSPDATKFHYYQLTYGVLVYALYYPPLLALVWHGWGTKGAAIFAASLIPTGFFARRYAGEMARRGSFLRFAWVSATRSYTVQDLRRLRRQLMADLDRKLSEYMKVRRPEGAASEAVAPPEAPAGAPAPPARGS